jgi:hypothetical protein
MRLHKANANDKIDDLAKAVKGKAEAVIDDARDVAAVAAAKARHQVHNAGEKIKHTGERIAGAGDKLADAGEKLMKKMAD